MLVLESLLDMLFFFLLQTDKIRQEHIDDMSILRAISIVFERKPELRLLIEALYSVSTSSHSTFVITLHCRLEGIAHKVLQWYLCRMEGWFAADADTISLKCWDQASFSSSLHTIFCLILR